MLSTQNILLPANGFPIAVPSQDMVLGLYYITYTGDDFEEQEFKGLISSYDEAEAAYKEGTLKLHDKVIARRNGGADGDYARAGALQRERRAGTEGLPGRKLRSGLLLLRQPHVEEG